MKRFILLFSLPAYAQLQEDFSDGDFTNNPPWIGTTSYWTITPDKRLRSNGPTTTSKIYLATANTLISNTEWHFWVRVGFNPSTSNFVRIYLVADRADPTDSNLQGYYLKLGGITGSNDSLELWYQQGSSHTRLAGGIRGRFGGTNNILRIRVLRNASGTWQVYSDSTGFWEEEFTTTHTALSSTAYFIVLFEHTNTNRQNLWLDDFYIGPIQSDNTPPFLGGAEFETSMRLLLTFSEALSPPSAGQPSNYSLRSPTGSIGIQQAVLTSPRTVALTLINAVAPSVLCTLSYAGIQDLAGNVGSGDTT
ncbi:MAG: Ig-like domain-containing protein, partial [Bacteroidia bacterium]|nr:Ig-like domain-containing protein [Bacteroidia bacterium]MDW8236673.1 Ig-like domain-containing protein [Bacteroidia bacterium]